MTRHFGRLKKSWKSSSIFFSLIALFCLLSFFFGYLWSIDVWPISLEKNFHVQYPHKIGRNQFSCPMQPTEWRLHTLGIHLYIPKAHPHTHAYKKNWTQRNDRSRAKFIFWCVFVFIVNYTNQIKVMLI